MGVKLHLGDIYIDLKYIRIVFLLNHRITAIIQTLDDLVASFNVRKYLDRLVDGNPWRHSKSLRTAGGMTSVVIYYPCDKIQWMEVISKINPFYP